VEVQTHGRLIDADALMSTIKENDYLLYDRLTDTTKPGMFTFGIEYAVCTAPTIEIIHCKDCKYGKQDDEGRWYCIDLGCQMGDEDGSGFCADAERRSDG
jgi:hypothetical protein